MSLKNKLHRRFPHLLSVREHPHLNAVLGRLLEHEYLWYFNRRAVARAVASGLFWAFVPVPFQMIFSSVTAFVIKANLPIAVLLVWISNPITIPPLVYFCHSIGQAVLGASSMPTQAGYEAWSAESISSFLYLHWQPFLLGCLIAGITAAVAGYFITRTAWHFYLRTHKRRRASGRTPRR